MSEDSTTGPQSDARGWREDATIPEPPATPDVPTPTPGGPDPSPEIPDLPEIPPIPAPLEPPTIPDLVEATAVTDQPSSAGPVPATMPTPGPVHPVVPMPTVAPSPRPVPMPTVSPSPAPAPEPAPPATPAAEPQAVAEAAATDDIDDWYDGPTGDSEPAKVDIDMPPVDMPPVDGPPTASPLTDTPPVDGPEVPATPPTPTDEQDDLYSGPTGDSEPADFDQPLATVAGPTAQNDPDDLVAGPTGDSEQVDYDAPTAVAPPPADADGDADPTGDSEPGHLAEPPTSALPTSAVVTEPALAAGSLAPHSPDVSEGPAPSAKPTAPGQHRPGQRPRAGRPGGPGGRPGGHPSPVPSAPSHAGVVEPVVESVDPHLWGRIDENGVVYVTTSAGERAIGNWQAGDTEAGLHHFGRKFDDLSTEIALLEARLASGTGDPKATKAQAIALRESVETLPAIGDLDSAAIRLEIVIGAADAAIAGASHARTAARAAAIKAKEALCVEAESLAESTQWKSTGDRLKAIVEEWRAIRGIDRKTDDALWKRFAKARDTFTRHRGSHFAELDKQRSAAKDAKEALIARAEALSDATDWGETAGQYRTLMEEWKAAGRAPRDVEDALWARFRAAQEKFFSRRNKTFSDRDAELEANAAIKEKLLAEAEKIDPAAGLESAKAKMRSIHERWEGAGKVPRERIREFDGRLRAVEDKLKSAEDRHWRRTDPETSARVAQFRSRVDSYRAQAAKARAAGDERKARDADAQASQWEEWLRTAQSAVDG